MPGKHKADKPTRQPYVTTPIIRESTRAQCTGIIVCPACMPTEYPPFAKHRKPAFRGNQCQEIGMNDHGTIIRCPLSASIKHEHLFNTYKMGRFF